MLEPSNTHAATPPKVRGLWQRVKSVPNPRKGGDSERRGRRGHPRSGYQVESEIPPVPDVPRVWVADSADPEQMMTFREILNSNGR